MRNFRRIAIAVLCTTVFGLVPMAAASSTSTSGRLTTLQSEQKATEAKLAAAQKQYTAAVNAYGAAQHELAVVNAELNASAQRLQTLDTEVAAAKGQLATLETQLAAAKVVVQNDQQQANSALVMVDENGFSVSVLSVVFGATSFSDFLTRLDMLQQVWVMTNQLLQKAQNAQDQVNALTEQQSSEVAHLTSLQNQAAAEVTTLHNQQIQANGYVRDEEQAQAAASAVVVNVEGSLQSLTAEINKLIQEIEDNSIPWSQVLSDINALAQQYGIDPLLVEAVVLQESGGDSKAKSSAGAVGLMQLMPGTAAELGVTNSYDPVQNLTGGITYLLELLHEFNGNLTDALAAYNAGSYAVKEYGGVPPYTQTENYVRDVESLYAEGR